VKEWRLYLGHYGVVLSLLSLALSVSILSVASYVWLDVNDELERYNEEMPKIRSEINLLEEQVSLADLIARNKRNATKVADRLYANVRQKDVVRTIIDVAATSNISVAEQNFDNKVIHDNMLTISQSIVVSGSYTAIRGALMSIQSELPGVSVIRKISMQRAPDQNITASMNIETYAAASGE